MKAKILKMSLWALLFPSISFAQTNNEQINIRVEKNINGKKEVFIKKIDASKMNMQERELAIQKVQDSLMAANKGNHQRIKIEITDSGDLEKMDNKRGFNDAPNQYQNDLGIGLGSDFERNLNKVGTQMRRFGEEVPQMFERHVKKFRNNFEEEITNEPIRNIDVYPNNPQTEVLNIHFFAIDKGDVAISIVDLLGALVTKTAVNNFTGEYVGQINTGKLAKGTYFVLVSQNGNGVSRRVIIP